MCTGSKCSWNRIAENTSAGNNKADIRSVGNTSQWNSVGWIRSAGNKHIRAQNTRGWENERVFLKHECEEHVCRMEYEWIRSAIYRNIRTWMEQWCRMYKCAWIRSAENICERNNGARNKGSGSKGQWQWCRDPLWRECVQGTIIQGIDRILAYVHTACF